MTARNKNESTHDARKKALRLLEHMDRTESGLREKLRLSGYTEEETEDAVSYVKDYGYVDDHRYALNYILYRIHGKSREKIFQELTRKGISRDTVSIAWEEACDLEEPDERSLLRDTILKKYEEYSELDEKEMRRLYGFLLRRGFRSGDISSVMDELHIKAVYRREE